MEITYTLSTPESVSDALKIFLGEIWGELELPDVGIIVSGRRKVALNGGALTCPESPTGVTTVDVTACGEEASRRFLRVTVTLPISPQPGAANIPHRLAVHIRAETEAADAAVESLERYFYSSCVH